jgi:hypothetical protein
VEGLVKHHGIICMYRAKRPGDSWAIIRERDGAADEICIAPVKSALSLSAANRPATRSIRQISSPVGSRR